MSLDPQPVPIIPKTSKKLKLLEFDPLEVARQLTMIECQLYMKIRPSECLMRSREHKSENHDNIAAIIVTTNKVDGRHDDLHSHKFGISFSSALDRALGGGYRTQ